MRGSRERSTSKLARWLQPVPGVPQEMIDRALSGYYSDYGSPLPAPQVQLVHDLRELASLPRTPRNSRPVLRELAARVIAGEFDATKEEADEWARSPEGQGTLKELLDGALKGPAAARNRMPPAAPTTQPGSSTAPPNS